MDGKKILFLALFFALLPLSRARAAVIEISGMVAYGKADFNDGYKSTQRRFSGSLDFKFTSVSAIQFEYADSLTKVSYPININSALPVPRLTQEATTYRDKIYSFNWVQNLVPSKWIVQPYFVIGGGKMKRKLTKEYPELGLIDSASQSVVTGTGGVGLRIFLTRAMAVKGEMKTYVPNFKFSDWKQNQLFSVGLSWAF